MKTTIQTYSLLFLGIFLISFGLRSAHFLEHYNEDVTIHKCDNQDHSHNSEKGHDCSLCDFTLSSFTEIDFFVFNPITNIINDNLINALYIEHISISDYRFFSLRAPPLV